MATKKEIEAFKLRLNKVLKDTGLRGPADLARVAKINKNTAGAYCRGDRLASLEACEVIGAALNCCPVWLYGGKTNMKEAAKSKIAVYDGGVTPEWSRGGKAGSSRKVNFVTDDDRAAREKLANMAKIASALRDVADALRDMYL